MDKLVAVMEVVAIIVGYNATKNILVYIFRWERALISLGTDLGVELLGQRTGMCLALVYVAKRFSKKQLFSHFYL